MSIMSRDSERPMAKPPCWLDEGIAEVALLLSGQEVAEMKTLLWLLSSSAAGTVLVLLPFGLARDLRPVLGLLAVAAGTAVAWRRCGLEGSDQQRG